MIYPTTPAHQLVTDWTPYAKYFKEKEFTCSHTGECKMALEFMDKLYECRTICEFPFIITSGYRDPTHPIEAAKKTPGFHAQGLAADIAVYNPRAYELVQWALALNFTGIGVSQRAGKPRFIHLDMRPTDPVIYAY